MLVVCSAARRCAVSSAWRSIAEKEREPLGAEEGRRHRVEAQKRRVVLMEEARAQLAPKGLDRRRDIAIVVE